MPYRRFPTDFNRIGGSICLGQSYSISAHHRRREGALSCTPCDTYQISSVWLSCLPSASERALFPRRSAIPTAITIIITARSTSRISTLGFSLTRFATSGGIALRTLSIPHAVFAGDGLRCDFRGQPPQSRRDEVSAAPKSFRHVASQYICTLHMYLRSGPRALGGNMDTGIVKASAWRREVPGILAAALLAIICLATPRTVSAAECDPHCDRNDHPSQYTDPRCELRRTAPNSERDELRCDFRARRRHTGHPAVSSATPQTPPHPAARPAGQAAVASGSDAGRQQPRGVERDVGFDDAFAPQTNSAPAVGMHGANADPFRHAPASRR